MTKRHQSNQIALYAAEKLRYNYDRHHLKSEGKQMDYKQNQMSNEDRMKWFTEAKLGIFIHWGIYSVLGVGES